MQQQQQLNVPAKQCRAFYAQPIQSTAVPVERSAGGDGCEWQNELITASKHALKGAAAATANHQLLCF